MTEVSETRFGLSFEDGEKVLVLITPDDPEAPVSRAEGGHMWGVEVRNASGEILGVRAAKNGESSDLMWYPVSNVLYQTILSNEVDRRTPEVQVWLIQVHQVYHARAGSR